MLLMKVMMIVMMMRRQRISSSTQEGYMYDLYLKSELYSELRVLERYLSNVIYNDQPNLLWLTQT